MASQKRKSQGSSVTESKKCRRQVTVATFNKWQKQYEREHRTLSWDVDSQISGHQCQSLCFELHAYVGVMFEHSHYTCERIIIITIRVIKWYGCMLFSPSYSPFFLHRPNTLICETEHYPLYGPFVWMNSVV